jgi:hypothetical protein
MTTILGRNYFNASLEFSSLIEVRLLLLLLLMGPPCAAGLPQ